MPAPAAPVGAAQTDESKNNLTPNFFPTARPTVSMPMIKCIAGPCRLLVVDYCL